jgi:hypothetical protein
LERRLKKFKKFKEFEEEPDPGSGAGVLDVAPILHFGFHQLILELLVLLELLFTRP